MTLDIGSRVRKARKHAGMTQNELAKKANTKQAVISDIENGRNKTSSALYDIAIATKVNPNWLLRGDGLMVESSQSSEDNVKRVNSKNIRMAPVLNYVQAGEFCEYYDDAIADRFEPVSIEYPDTVYWVELDGLSMIPDFHPSELVLINPDIQPAPGDFVLALKAGDKSVTFKKWRPRGFDENGVEYCELVPSNPDFPVIDSRHTPFNVCGVAVEHKKRLK